MQELLNITVISSFDDQGDWEYKDANTKQFTHCFHNYPAMMIPQIARRLLIKYKKSPEGMLFDPYCGTGSSITEGMLFGINSIGTDINPLAKLIAKTKTTPIEINKLKMSIDILILELDKYSKDIELNLINSNYLNNWFKEKTIKKLCYLKSLIEKIENQDIKDFFLVAFSETVRECSLTRNKEFKLLKIPKHKLLNFDPDAYSIMKSKLYRNLKGMVDFMYVYNNHKIKPQGKVYDFNSVKIIPDEIIKPTSIDIVITSPPYGDSHTTVAYGQFSRLSNEWIGFKNPEKIDKNLMGGRKLKELIKFNFPKLDNCIDIIAEKDEKRALEVCSFYYELMLSIKNVSEVVKPKGHVCYVVGNRIVKGVQLPTSEAIISFYKRFGFEHIDTFIRGIPNKRMPLKK